MGDDPSTAWQTTHGEWRLIGNQQCSSINSEGNTVSGAPLYGSMDFKKWYKIGCTQLKLGDCPTFFPLPALYPGTTASAKMPNYVHKAGSGNDQVQVGVLSDGAPGLSANASNGAAGSWTQM